MQNFQNNKKKCCLPYTLRKMFQCFQFLVYTRNDPTVKKLVSHSNHLTLYYFVHYDKKSAFYWFFMTFIHLVYSQNIQFNYNSLRHRGIVVMDFDCYTGDRGSIPTHGDSLGKWMNLRAWVNPCLVREIG